MGSMEGKGRARSRGGTKDRIWKWTTAKKGNGRKMEGEVRDKERSIQELMVFCTKFQSHWYTHANVRLIYTEISLILNICNF